MSSISAITAGLIALFSIHSIEEKREVKCLAENIYHEARGEKIDGMIAVALVTKNRVESSRFPQTYCGVVYDKAQFSWTLERPRPKVLDEALWHKAVTVAARVVSNDFAYPGFIADHYANLKKANPTWRYGMRYEGRIGDHWFYSSRDARRVQTAMADGK